MKEEEEGGIMAELRAISITTLVLSLLAFQQTVLCQEDSTPANPLDFDPKVTASCTEFPYMKITVQFNQPFHGVVHTKDHRTDACEVFGDGSPNVTLVLNVMAEPNAANNCGVKQDEQTGERYVSVFVRYHKTLERLEDKVFSISCNNPGYMNSRNEISRISMSFLESGRKTQEVVKGRQYILRIQETNPDGKFHLKVKKCFSFSTATQERVELTDDRGCPLDPSTMSRFKYDEAKGTAEAIVFSMFKFPGSKLVNINCLVAACRGPCAQESCDGKPQAAGRSIDDNAPYQFWTAESAYVVDPTDPSSMPLVDCSIHRFSWLLGLCIAFGVLFFIMLIVNILLCSALTCSCAKQEVIEREPSVIEDYDPYKGGGWGSGSQYGSRYSLNGKHDYPSGGSTLNSTTRSLSTNSDHYAVVHSHPGNNRYHGGGGGGDDRSLKGGFRRGPESTISNSNHSGRI